METNNDRGFAPDNNELDNVGKKLQQTLTQLIESGGDTVGIDTPACVIHKSEHSSCNGCSSELGCGKLARIMLAQSMAALYTPANFDDLCNVTNRVQKLQMEIFKAKTVEELDKLSLV
jgi:hypothetical protein